MPGANTIVRVIGILSGLLASRGSAHTLRTFDPLSGSLLISSPVIRVWSTASRKRFSRVFSYLVKTDLSWALILASSGPTTHSIRSGGALTFRPRAIPVMPIRSLDAFVSGFGSCQLAARREQEKLARSHRQGGRTAENWSSSGFLCIDGGRVRRMQRSCHPAGPIVALDRPSAISPLVVPSATSSCRDAPVSIVEPSLTDQRLHRHDVRESVRSA